MKNHDRFSGEKLGIWYANIVEPLDSELQMLRIFYVLKWTVLALAFVI